MIFIREVTPTPYGYCTVSPGAHSGVTGVFTKIVQETRAQIWPNLAPEYICRFVIDSLSPDSSLFKSAGCQTVNFGHVMLFAFEK